MHPSLDSLLLEEIPLLVLLLEETSLLVLLLEETPLLVLLLEEIPLLVLLLANLIQLCLHQLRVATNHHQLHRYQAHRREFQRWDHHQEVLLLKVDLKVDLKEVLLQEVPLQEEPTLVKVVMRLQLQILEEQLLHLLVE